MRTTHLELTDTGKVYKRNPENDDEYLGRIDDIDACPRDLLREWRYLQDELEDQRRFADGCAWTARNAWSMAQGDSRRW